MRPVLDKDYYDNSTENVARNLLGKTLVRVLDDGTRLSGIVVEVEAYLSTDDAASHSAIGQTKRNASMFGTAGTLYVYTIHNRHCLNVVTEPAGVGSAVLIRAVEPVEGIVPMAHSRNIDPDKIETRTGKRSIATGPGRLCQAFRVDLSLDAANLTQSKQICLEEALPIVEQRSWQTNCSARIGISRSQEKMLRFFIDGHQLVSGCARDHTQGRTWTFQI